MGEIPAAPRSEGEGEVVRVEPGRATVQGGVQHREILEREIKMVTRPPS